MKENAVDTITSCMVVNDEFAHIQRIQIEHRLKLAQFWGIEKGSRILEIGCGQGDTTAVLAYLTGDDGFVHGIDIAAPDYGSPVTIGDSINHLQHSKLGKQIKVDFETDLLSQQVDFPENSFDIIVMSHCSWYFKSFEELSELLKKARKWGSKLCFAEWDTRIQTIEQLPHLLSVLIQAQYECFKENSLSNVRTMFTPDDITTIASSVGWNIVDEKSINSKELQDGEWEVDIALMDYHFELSDIDNMPSKLKSLIKSEVNLLEESIKNHGIKSLSTHALIADKR